MSTNTAVQLLATQAANNLALILIILVIAIVIALYSCLYLSGTISQQEEATNTPPPTDN
jgi:flagellar basal body-associated protein FliL